ncbi:MAG: hypothetical protein AAGF92_20125 [Myxococcota bacterium]
MADKKLTRGGKKERVLHTRVPAVLEQELKRVATAWRVPVSNVVRALLEDALDTVDVVGRKAEGELRGVAEMLASERSKLRRASAEQLGKIATDEESEPEGPRATPDDGDPLSDAIGVTPITLVHDEVCGVTGQPVAAGTSAYLVLFRQPGKQMIAGPDALPDLSAPEETHHE